MADLFFPQLSTGVLAQYPIRKTIARRTIRNNMPDGSLLSAPDADASYITWSLAYQGLTFDELASLSSLFADCQGRFRSFTFIDPIDNMLLQSAAVTTPPWIASPGLQITRNAADPVGGESAFTITNVSQAPAQLSQTLAVPSNFRYCFSVYVTSSQAETVTLSLSGSNDEQTLTGKASPTWKRIVLSGALKNPGTGITVSIIIAPGVQLSLFGPQLEAQVAPSRYRPTFDRCGIYSNAHWGIDGLPIVCEAPNVYSTAFSVEAALE